MEILNEKVRLLRLQRNWTQQHLADACDISLPTLQRIEKYGNASHESVMSLCAVLEIDKQELSVIPSVDRAALSRIQRPFPLFVMLPSLFVGVLLGVVISHYLLK